MICAVCSSIFTSLISSFINFDLLCSGKFIPLLFATSPRLFGYAAAFTPYLTANSSLARNIIHGSSIGRNKLFSSTDKDTMSDEVSKAKAAAAEYKSSDKDGAGPDTVFDKILSGEWSSKKVHEDDLALAFRE